jgi:hypothetical protein
MGLFKMKVIKRFSCLAAGWPAPTYQWFKEEYVNNTLVSQYLDPLTNPKYTISGGMLIIDTPKQLDDRGNYHCVATNEFGSIISESVSISFGYIGEFIPTRSVEVASQYWGKAIYCDPPNHFPSRHFPAVPLSLTFIIYYYYWAPLSLSLIISGVLYYWSRRYFPNVVEENERVFVSYDGNLYISSVDSSDNDQYICHVQSTVSSSGRTGPTFALQVTPNCKYYLYSNVGRERNDSKSPQFLILTHSLNSQLITRH